LISASLAGNAPAATIAENGRVADLAFSASSSRRFLTRWSEDPALGEVAALSTDAFGRVVGSVRNPLGEPLEQAVLFYGGYARALGTIGQGESVAVDGRGDWRSAQAYLARQRLSHDRDTAERFDPTDVDLDRIGEIIAFYDAAGGAAYTGLSRGESASVDLSRQLQLGRAILMGRTTTPASVKLSASTTANAHRQSTWWRFLFRPSAALSGGK
jgi:hypothetical protein